MTTTLTPMLKPGVLYVAGARLVCATIPCAGQVALFTGTTDDGTHLRPIKGRDVIQLSSSSPGQPMVSCECGALAAVFSMRDGLNVEPVQAGGGAA